MNENTKILLLLVLNLTNVSGAGCPTGWTPKEDSGLCYKYYTSITNHRFATDQCFHEEAILATPKNSSDVDYLANNVIGSLFEYVWVGLVKRSFIEPWTFADGPPLKSTMASWDLWDNGFPSSTSSAICVYMTATANEYKFKNANCNSEYHFICQKTMIQHSCLPGWIHSPGGSICYRKFGESYSYNQSLDICNSNGSYILMPGDPHEDMFFSWYLNKYQNFKKIWMGYKLQNSHFIWESGNQANYTGWEDDEPHSWEDCAVYASNGKSFHRWYGLDCSLTAATYCQDTNFLNTIDTTTVQDTTVSDSQMTTLVTTETTPGTTQTTPGTTETTPGTTQTTPGTTQTTPGTTQTTPSIDQTTSGTTQTTSGTTQTTPGTDKITSVITNSTPITTQTTPGNIDTTPVITQITALSFDASTQSGDSTTVFTEAQTTRESTLTSSTSQSTTASTTMIYSSTSFTDLSCGCLCYGNKTNITTEELQEILIQIKSNLTVDTKTLSSAIRQLTSAHDSRVSSKSIGSVGVAVLVSVMIFLLFLDLVPVKGDCVLMKKGK